jgi:phasin family protein
MSKPKIVEARAAAVSAATPAGAAKDAMKPVEEAVAAGRDVVETVYKAGAEAAQKGYEQAVEMTRQQIEKSRAAWSTKVEELNDISKQNLEAIAQSSQIVAKGAEEVGQHMAALVQAAVERQVGATKALLGCKSLREVFEVQNGLARENIHGLMSEGAWLSEMSVKTASKAMEPIQGRVTVTVEKLFQPIAA